MNQRAIEQNTTIDQLTPTSEAEIHIKQGFAQTMQIEAVKKREQEHEHEQVVRLAYDSLRALPAAEFTRTHDARGREHQAQDRTLSEEFSRRHWRRSCIAWLRC